MSEVKERIDLCMTMTKYEKLLSEYEEEIRIEEHEMINEGLYCDNTIWINKSLPENKKICILAEEIAHHKTSYGDILNQKNIVNRKQELTARRYAHKMLIPIEDILEALKNGYREVYEIAEYLNLDEMFVRECLKEYGWL